MNINRDYLIINDVKKSNITLDNGSIFFYITDKNTQNIFVNLVINISNNELIQKYANIENAEDYTLTMNIVKPDNTYKIIEGKLHDKEKAIFEFNLNEDCCDEIGPYRCELLTKCNINDHEEITTSNKLTYKVKSSVLNDLDDIVEAPEYPLAIQLFDKLSDINQYEEDRRANELARQLAEEQRQARFNVLDADMSDRIETIDDKLVEIDNVLISKEDIADIKAKNTEQDRRLDVAENRLDNINTNIENVLQPTVQRVDAIEAINATQNNRLDAIEVKNTEQDGRLDIAENRLANIGNDITNTMQPIIDGHTSRLDAIEAVDVAQNSRLDAIEVKNQQQDDRLLDIEKVNKQQGIDIKCLYGASQTIDMTEEGNSVYLQNSNNGFAVINEIQGNTLVNCNKEPNKELILNGNINTSGDNTVTITEGVDGGLVDVALEGNTLVNVSKTKDSTTITKAYTVENSGNHIALQGDVDGNCRPVITGNTLWIDNATEEVLTAFDETKSLRLQSTFEDNLVTQEMVDSGEEVADNLGKYKVDYKSTKEDGTVGSTKTLYLNSPLLEGDTIEEKDGAIYHVHRYKEIVLDGSYDNTKTDVISGVNYYRVGAAPTPDGNTECIADKYIGTNARIAINQKLDKCVYVHSNGYIFIKDSSFSDINGLISKLQQNPLTLVYRLYTPQYELIEQSNLVIPSYANGHLDFDTAVPVEKVKFKSFSEELTYLYANTQYTVQFVSDRATVADLILGGTQLLAQNIVVGLNRIAITTSATLVDNKLIISGIANISEVVVTDTDREFGYFEGMKSVGEGGNLVITSNNRDNTLSNTQQLTHEPLRAVGDYKDRYVLINGTWFIEKKCGIRAYQEGDKDNYKTDLVNTVYPLEMPIYEEIDYNPFEVYTGTTHITTNSTIPANVVVKNHGFNCLLKPSTTYTISSNLGLNTVTTPSTLTEGCLRFMDTDTSDVTTMKNVLVLEGDWTTKADSIPANFSGIESAFEQQLVTDEEDEHHGKYKVNVRVTNEDKTRENNITFYINEPLRGTDDAKDRVYVKDDKVIVERNCKQENMSELNFAGDTSNTMKCLILFKSKPKAISNIFSNSRDYESITKGQMYAQERGNGMTYLWIPTDSMSREEFTRFLNEKNATIVYVMSEPTYEEVEYNDTKLLIELFKNSTLSYNSNVPVTSKLYYSYSVPIVDTVAQTANISDQQDSMIIDLATQVAVMEMMLM